MSFDQSIQRIGFCCKYLDPDQTQKPKILKEIQQNYTEKQTTVAWMKRQDNAVAEQRMLDIVEHNMQSAYNLVKYVGGLPEMCPNEKVGYVVDKKVQDIAKAVDEFYSKPENFFHPGIQEEKKKYEWSHFVNKVEELYKKL